MTTIIISCVCILLLAVSTFVLSKSISNLKHKLQDIENVQKKEIDRLNSLIDNFEKSLKTQQNTSTVNTQIINEIHKIHNALSTFNNGFTMKDSHIDLN